MKANQRSARFGGPYVVDAFLRAIRGLGGTATRPLGPVRMTHTYLLLGVRTEQVTTRTLLQAARVMEGITR